MNTTGIFTTLRYEIGFSKYNKPIYLIPFGDIHRSSPLCHTEKWLEFLDWAKSKENAYFLGMGDYDDLGSASERKILGNDDLHEATKETLEDIYTRNVDLLTKELKFMKGRIVGLLEGNHYGLYQSNITTTQLLAQKLGCAYLGVSAFVRLTFKPQSGHNAATSLDVWAHHGMGAARLIGGSLNRVQQMVEAADAHIYLMGHDHKKSVGMITRLTLHDGRNSLRLRQKKVVFARTGSFLKGYEEGKPSYIVDKAMNPTDLGVVKIELTPKREKEMKSVDGSQKENKYIDIHASI